ncbi:MAG: CRISPR-associated endonuclease Cas2 [Planctomycetes bacterium]|nr:CRISPR-associated endonuclease Cas2 [Planctomycetota bacterium]
MLYLVAYDIADPGRLRRVARFLERRSVRCQKSVYLFEGTAQQLASLLDQAATFLDPHEDCLQAWRLDRGQPREGRTVGVAAVTCPAAVVAAGRLAVSIPHDFQ